MSQPTIHPSGISRSFKAARKQRGLTLVELMISMTLGLLVVLAATGLLVSSKSSYTTQDDDAVVRDTGRFALENIARSLRQAAFENWDKEDSPFVTSPEMKANLSGLDARTLIGSSGTAGMATESEAGVVNGSDVLAVRFFGAGSKTTGSISKDGYGSIIDCAGFGVSAPISQATAEEDRAWSIYYVANDASGEPELRCKYRGQKSDGTFSWNWVAIARGIESFQVLYGVDSDGDRIPDQFMTATQIDAKDASLNLEGATTELKQESKNKQTWWKKVRVVKVALLVRGSRNVQSNTSDDYEDYYVKRVGGAKPDTIFYLFGSDYNTANASNDVGTTISVRDNLDTTVQRRVRKPFQANIQFRNVAEGSGKAKDQL